VQRGRKRGTDWEGQQRERVRTEQFECGHVRADYSGAGRSSGTEHADDIDPWLTDKLIVLSIIDFFLSIGVLGVCCDVTGFVERPVRDGVANPGALVVCPVVRDPFNERFLARVDISTACLSQMSAREVIVNCNEMA